MLIPKTSDAAMAEMSTPKNKHLMHTPQNKHLMPTPQNKHLMPG